MTSSLGIGNSMWIAAYIGAGWLAASVLLGVLLAMFFAGAKRGAPSATRSRRAEVAFATARDSDEPPSAARANVPTGWPAAPRPGQRGRRTHVAA
jgi:hypothetical protein